MILRREADGGDAQAQLALSIALAHGLGGAPVNPDQAMIWRARALSARTYQPITQYTAAFNGQPSRVNIINVPQPAISLAQTRAVDPCLMFLVNRAGDLEACGTDQRAAQLHRDWIAAVNRRAR